MPKGEGTYGSQVGRPRKKKGSLLNDDRERYGAGSIIAKVLSKKIVPKEKFIADRISKDIMKDLSDEQLSTLIAKNKARVKQLEEDNKFYKDFEVVDVPLKEMTKHQKLALETQHKKESIKMFSRELEKRTKKAEGGNVDDQMEGLAISVEPVTVEKEIEEQQLPDEEMEADYVDFVVNSTLSEEDQNYLEGALAEDTKLSELFDQVIESASEFSGSGPIEGPGTEVSDSIPARLSDGEFVFTAKATEDIGEDSLMSMMKDAEAAADERQGVAYGGVIDEEDQAVPVQTKGLLAAQGNIPNVAKQSRQVEEEMLKSSPRRYYVPVSG